MTEQEKRLKRLLRRVDDLDRQEGRLRKYLDSRTYLKPGEKRKRKLELARWRRTVNPRDIEFRTLDGSIWKNGELLVPRKPRHIST